MSWNYQNAFCQISLSSEKRGFVLFQTALPKHLRTPDCPHTHKRHTCAKSLFLQLLTYQSVQCFQLKGTVNFFTCFLSFPSNLFWEVINTIDPAQSWTNTKEQHFCLVYRLQHIKHERDEYGHHGKMRIGFAKHLSKCSIALARFSNRRGRFLLHKHISTETTWSG